MADVVLVADMVRGFCEPGHNLYIEAIREIIPPMRAFLEREKGRGSHLIFLCDTHDPNDLEFQMFPPHCVQGTEEPEVIPELRDLVDEIMPKRRFSGFFETPLAERLRAMDPARLILVGDCTNICILYTAADARARDYDVEVPADLVATFDPVAHKHALEQLRSVLGCRVTSSAGT